MPREKMFLIVFWGSDFRLELRETERDPSDESQTEAGRQVGQAGRISSQVSPTKEEPPIAEEWDM